MSMYTEAKEKEEKSEQERIFDLECQVSMLTELVVQLIGELNDSGISVSNKLKD